MSPTLVSQLLGYSGLLPFFGFSLATHFFDVEVGAWASLGFIVYSLSIYAFLAGALWGQAQGSDSSTSAGTLITSNALVLFGVAATLLGQAETTAALMIPGYLLLLVYESRVTQQANWYRTMRRRLTAGVVLAHLLFIGLQATSA
jgi:hypothetical protein